MKKTKLVIRSYLKMKKNLRRVNIFVKNLYTDFWQKEKKNE